MLHLPTIADLYQFMQRGAASASSASSSKRAKTSRDSSPASYITDAQAIQIALQQEEAQRDAAYDRQGLERAETRWVLSVQNERRNPERLEVTMVGWSELAQVHSEADRSGEERSMEKGRRSFGNFKRASEVSIKSTVLLTAAVLLICLENTD